MKKKLLALLLAAIMTVGMGVSTVAAPMNVQQSMSLSSVTLGKTVSAKKTKKLTEKQLIQLADEADDLFQCKELSTFYVNKKTNDLELEVVKQVTESLQKKIDAIKKKYGINVKVQIVDDDKGMLLEDETENPPTSNNFVAPKVNRESLIYDFADYLRDKLSSKSYSYVKAYAQEGRVEIGVPSAKAVEEAAKYVEIYRNAKGIKYIDQLHPEEEYINVEYRLCKYSYADVLKAYTDILKDSFVKENRENGTIYDVNKFDGYLHIQYNEKTKELENWRNNSKYADMIVLEAFYKVNLQ